MHLSRNNPTAGGNKRAISGICVFEASARLSGPQPRRGMSAAGIPIGPFLFLRIISAPHGPSLLCQRQSCSFIMSLSGARRPEGIRTRKPAHGAGLRDFYTRFHGQRSDAALSNPRQASREAGPGTRTGDDPAPNR